MLTFRVVPIVAADDFALGAASGAGCGSSDVVNQIPGVKKTEEEAQAALDQAHKQVRAALDLLQGK